jgi:hypothetical protein
MKSISLKKSLTKTRSGRFFKFAESEGSAPRSGYEEMLNGRNDCDKRNGQKGTGQRRKPVSAAHCNDSTPARGVRRWRSVALVGCTSAIPSGFPSPPNRRRHVTPVTSVTSHP